MNTHQQHAHAATVLAPLPEAVLELDDADLDGVTGGLVVNAIIAVLIQPLLPGVQKGDLGTLTPDQLKQVAAGNPLPRPR